MIYKSRNEEIFKKVLEREEEDYSMFDADTLANFCQMQDRNLKQYVRCMVNACDVIDFVAELLQIEIRDCAFCEIYEDGASVVMERFKKYIEKGGDKVKMNKWTSKLENENAVLRSLVSKLIARNRSEESL